MKVIEIDDHDVKLDATFQDYDTPLGAIKDSLVTAWNNVKEYPDESISNLCSTLEKIIEYKLTSSKTDAQKSSGEKKIG